jgi:hypothetical protein
MRILFLLLMLSLASCSPGHHEVKVNDLYAITLPADMKPVADLHEDASLQQSDASRPLYVVVIDESKEEMQKHELDYDLEIYFENIVSRKLVESLPEVSIAPPRKTTLAGASALVTDVTGKTASEDIYYKIAVIETPNAFYQVLTWTQGAKRKEMEPEMEKIVNSFRELKQ